MLKLLNSEQIRLADRYTITHEPIQSLALMERAAKAAFESIELLLKSVNYQRIDVLCGPGNNGGDGLVIARLLKAKGYEVKVLFADLGLEPSPDCKINLERFDGDIVPINSESHIDREGVLIDALFGSGLNRKIGGWLADFVKDFNQQYEYKISIDMPSGLFDEKNDHQDQAIIQANDTITFQQPKLSQLFPENAPFVGNLHVVDIGLDQDFIDALDSKFHLMEAPDIKACLKPRLQFSHKGTYGHALLIAGEYGKAGAAVLSARAALASGVGLLTVAVPSEINSVMQSAVPEAMTVDSGQRYFEVDIPIFEKCTAIGIGPGLGKELKTKDALQKFLVKADLPMVLDADALNLLAEHSELLNHLRPNTILSPHPGEFQRLVGKWENDFERLQKQMTFSIKHQCYLILKGKYTSISTPEEKVYFNPTGNAGMATGGSGDVLTGILMGLLAQGFSTEKSCLLGVYLHGLSGDLSAGKKGQISMTASDLVENLGEAFQMFD